MPSFSNAISPFDGKLPGEAEAIGDEFARARGGRCSRRGAVERLARFVDGNRDERTPDLLRPAVWPPPLPTGAPAGSGQVQGPLVHVGLSSWIIQDGNYGDFAVGQEAEFALEVYAPKGLRPVEHGPPLAEHLGASRYRVRGLVLFTGPNVWVIGTGSFMAFQEQPPPGHVRDGSWVEGEICLGIDPYFYFEYLHRLDGMPPLTYSWVMRGIVRETTPWMEAKNEKGQTCRTRDERRESFVPIRKTDAWHDDGGDAHYVLECERLSGPFRPT